MVCLRCKKELFDARILVGGIDFAGGYEVILAEKNKKKLLQVEKRCAVLCYVCPQCGHIELLADDPNELQSGIPSKE